MRQRIMATGFFTLLIVFVYLSGVQAPAQDEFPSQPIEVITHAGTGGGTDVTTRMMISRARVELQQDLIVVNKRGGTGAEAIEYFLTRPADGYTMLAFTTDHAITTARGETELTIADIRPIARAADDPQIFMVNCHVSPYKTAQELVGAMKSTKLRFGTTNEGGIDHISTYVFAQKGGLMQPEIVPFSGGGAVATQLVAESVDVGVLNFSEASAQIESGIICPLLVLAAERMGPLPDVTTARELGIDAVFATVRGFVTHAAVPDQRAAILEENLITAMNDSVYQGFLQSIGLDASSVAGAQAWGEQIKKMIADMTPAIKEMGL